MCFVFFSVPLAFSQKAFPMEHEDDPPLLPPIVLHSPGREEHFNSFTSVQVNVNANGMNILGDAANEPSIAVSPVNRNLIAVGWRQFNNVASNFRQAGFGYSTNGGNTWTFPGVLENNVFRSDPVLGFTSTGEFYYLSLKQDFYCDIWGSSNGGSSWTRIADAVGGDKQWMTIDRSGGAGNGFIHQSWSTAGNNYGGRQYSRSTNSGAAWLNPTNIPDRPVWGTLDFGINGELYLVGTDNSLPSLRFVRSINANNGGVTPTFDLSTFVDMGGDILYGGDVNPGGLCGQAWIAADRSNGPTRGNLYILCSVTGNASNPCDVKFRRSTDGGATWSPVRRINDDPVNQSRYHWFGTMTVAPNGRIDVIWNDTRADPSNTNSALYYCWSRDGGNTWAPNLQVSNSWNHFLGYPNQSKMGDYIDMVSHDEDADVAYCATFNGEQDVYYVRLRPTPMRISGTVALQDYIAPVLGRPITIEIRNVGSTTPLQSTVVNLASTGAFTLDVSNTLLPGTYDVAAKGSHWLRKKLGSISVNTVGANGLAFELINGDVDGDNEVTLVDFGRLSAAFGTSLGDAGFDLEADLNGDQEVNLFDYAILAARFTLVGHD